MLLDRLTGVQLHVPSDLVAGNEATLTASYTTRHGSVSTGLITYHWLFGDGFANTSTAPRLAHTFLAPGNYSINLVADNFFTTSSVFNEVFVGGKLWG